MERKRFLDGGFVDRNIEIGTPQAVLKSIV